MTLALSYWLAYSYYLSCISYSLLPFLLSLAFLTHSASLAFLTLVCSSSVIHNRLVLPLRSQCRLMLLAGVPVVARQLLKGGAPVSQRPHLWEVLLPPSLLLLLPCGCCLRLLLRCILLGYFCVATASIALSVGVLLSGSLAMGVE